ncbi:MAG: metal-sensing transcriptional repressor [Elusimicrobiales bacterium]
MKAKAIAQKAAAGKAKTGRAGNAHANAPEVQNRLARIEGHIRAIRRMAAEEVPCPEVLLQLAAVRSALNGVGRIILDDHLRECVVKAVHDGKYEKAFGDLKRSLDRFIA